MPLDAANLVKWFQERPFWIQEATRLLLGKENLTAADLSGLATLCKQQAVEPKTTPKPAVLPEAAFAQKAAGLALRLKSISEIKGIDALNPRSPLTFNDEPLTIVYGGTGVLMPIPRLFLTIRLRLSTKTMKRASSRGLLL